MASVQSTYTWNLTQLDIIRHKIIINQSQLTESRYCTNSKHISLHSAFIFFKFFSSKYSLDAAAEIPSSLAQISTQQHDHDFCLIHTLRLFDRVIYVLKNLVQETCVIGVTHVQETCTVPETCTK